MALSSWDTLAVGLNGEPQIGSFMSPGGIEVVIYKNWLYIRDSKAWREGGGFRKDTIMEIIHGEIHYHDVYIRATRGPQGGVYVACWSSNYGKQPSDYTGMIGCGVYGYDDKIWVGVKPESVEFLQKWIAHKERTWENDEIEQMVADLANPEIDPKDWEQELRESFVYNFPDEIAKVKLDMGVRYNQGNMYFSEKIGMPLEKSKPGEFGEFGKL